MGWELLRKMPENGETDGRQGLLLVSHWGPEVELSAV